MLLTRIAVVAGVADLPPVDGARLVDLLVEPVRVDPADGELSIIDALHLPPARKVQGLSGSVLRAYPEA